jgi:pyruvate/2-oxoglutarate dehydrogenase complex dihydrolipoamide acyltransferase (E2) component
MARVEMVMPKMGESIMEGTVIEWSKKVGDHIEQDETILEIATDKVDSEVPAPESGVLVEILAEAGDTIEVGKPIAIIETDPAKAGDVASGASKNKDAAADEEEESVSAPADDGEAEKAEKAEEAGKAEKAETGSGDTAADAGDEAEQDEPEEKTATAGSANGSKPSGDTPPQRKGNDGRFYSPLVRSIAEKEGISMEELEQIEGSGAQGRVSKQDVLDYLESRGEAKPAPAAEKAEPKAEKPPVQSLSKPVDSKEKPDTSRISAGEINVHWPTENVEIVKMDRMRKVIAEHMIRSKQTSAHVTTFGEADVTNLVKFRNRHKDRFFKENGFKLTFTPFFIEATIQAIREFPLINSSVDGENILLKRDINYGIAVALGESGTGGLIVPVIKNAGEMNIHGLARATHDLAEKARSKKLSPDDLVGGTFTLTNYGSVGNLMGTPIINQPQVAIFGTGVIQKRPMVMETEVGDVIAVRQMVYLSMSYDHRIVDGALGGAFVQKVIKNLENFDVNRSV